MDGLDLTNAPTAFETGEMGVGTVSELLCTCAVRQEFRSTSACVLEIDGKSAKAGSVCGGASDMSPCSGAGRRKCCLPGFNLAICTCTK